MNIASIHSAKTWFQVLQTSRQSQTAMMRLEAGGQSSGEPATHVKSDQVLLVLEGELEATVGGKKSIMRQGDTCIVAAGTPHRFENRGHHRAVTFNVYSPPEYPEDEKG